MFMLKKIARVFKSNRYVVPEPKNVENDREMKMNDLHDYGHPLSPSMSSVSIQSRQFPDETSSSTDETDCDYYRNVNLDLVSVSSDEGSWGSGYVNGNVSSMHSFAIDSDYIVSNAFNEAEEEECWDIEKMACHTFERALESTETLIQSSIEAYNEYVRLKHTIVTIQKFPMNKENQSSRIPLEHSDVYLRCLTKCLEDKRKALELDYPHLHRYSRRRGLTRFVVKKIDKKNGKVQ